MKLVIYAQNYIKYCEEQAKRAPGTVSGNYNLNRKARSTHRDYKSNSVWLGFKNQVVWYQLQMLTIQRRDRLVSEINYYYHSKRS